MSYVRSFDNLDDMFEFIRRGNELAKNAATPEQNAITYGDYWMREWEDIQIFGFIHTRAQVEQESANACENQEEYEYEMKVLADTYADGYRYGTAYSVACPEGELGDTHVCTMTKITKEQFEEAKANGWQLD